MVDFHGFLLPIQFSSIVEEHLHVRKSSGVFDVSHMGKYVLSGPGAEAFLDKITPGKVTSLVAGKILYSAIMLPDGSPIDDILIYRMGEEDWLFVVNAANRENVVTHIEAQKDESFTFIDETRRYTQLAVQGPTSPDVMAELFSDSVRQIDYYHFSEITYKDQTILVSRTGYTGEDGFEIYGSPEITQEIYAALLADNRILPIGLGARDSLRLEARYPLYSQELMAGRSLIQSGLSWIVDWKKENFTGRDALLTQKEKGEKNHLTAWVLEEAGVPRTGYTLLDASGEEVGSITSGGFAPSLGKGILIAWLDDPEKKPVSVQIRNQTKAITEIKGTFVPNRTLRGKAGL